MSKAAAEQANYVGVSKNITHKGGDGSSGGARLAKYGTVKIGLAENAFISTTTAKAIMTFIIDDGVPGRGHRNNTFNPTYTRVCVGVFRVPQNQFGIVIDFAGGYVENK